MTDSRKVEDVIHPVVSIHQPNFIPWPGYFNKIISSDIFIWLDTAQFTKNSLQNRNRILINHDVHWLTIPVLIKGCLGAPTTQIKTNHQVNWRKTHLSTVSQSYAKTKYYDEVFSLIENSYLNESEFLADFCVSLNLAICSYLNIPIIQFKASALDERGFSTDRILSLIKSVGGRTYLSGASGRNYLDLSLFQNENVNLVFQDFHLNAYHDFELPFKEKLSIIDLLFHKGKQSIDWIEGKI